MRIIEICPFSAGGCGVWARAFTESQEFKKKGYRVLVFTSNREKGTGKKLPLFEERQGVKIKRFKGVYYPFTDNVVNWFVLGGAHLELKKLILDEKEQPDIIITHLLHPHSFKLAKMITRLKKSNPKLKLFIVPHAPFNVKRKFPLNMLTGIWRSFMKNDAKMLKKFDRVISIAAWERAHLKNLGVDESMILDIPNGLPEAYFTTAKKVTRKRDVLFMGRVAPVKNIELLLAAAQKLPHVSFTVMGPAEPHYLKKLQEIKPGNVHFDLGTYNMKQAIHALDNHTIFLLPSKREAMPQVLLEAMARGEVVISSDTDGGREIIKDGKNGFIFHKTEDLANLILSNLNGNVDVQNQAKTTAKKYSWSNLIKVYDKIIC